MKLADAERHDDLYPDRHLNVFVPFESHDLDYNVTRALVATLRWSAPEVTREFLAEIAGVTVETEDADYHYDMQACDYEDFDPEDVAQQVVLGISRAGEVAKNLPSLDDVNQDAIRTMLRMPFPLEVKLDQVRRALGRHELDVADLATLAHTLDELEDGSLPDGWVFSARADVCVLIEAKLLERLDLYQLQRYADVYYGRSQRPEQLVLKTWDTVANFFAQRRSHDDPRTAFLCSQLHDYLDLLGLSDFHGFRPYDFDPDSVQEALAKFRRFGQAAHDRATAVGLPLGPLRPTPTGFRLSFSDPDLPGELNVELREVGIRFEHRLGDAPAGHQPGRAALDVLLQAAEPPQLEGLKEGLRVRIERHVAGASDDAFHLERTTLDEALDPAEFGEYVLGELRRQHPPEAQSKDVSGHYRRAVLGFGRTMPRAQAVGSGDGQAVLNLAVETIGELVGLARQLSGQKGS